MDRANRLSSPGHHTKVYRSQLPWELLQDSSVPEYYQKIARNALLPGGMSDTYNKLRGLDDVVLASGIKIRATDLAICVLQQMPLWFDRVDSFFPELRCMPTGLSFEKMFTHTVSSRSAHPNEINGSWYMLPNTHLAMHHRSWYTPNELLSTITNGALDTAVSCISNHTDQAMSVDLPHYFVSYKNRHQFAGCYCFIDKQQLVTIHNNPTGEKIWSWLDRMLRGLSIRLGLEYCVMDLMICQSVNVFESAIWVAFNAKQLRGLHRAPGGILPIYPVSSNEWRLLLCQGTAPQHKVTQCLETNKEAQSFVCK